MRRYVSVLVCSLAVAALADGNIHAQTVLYTLESPNPEEGGYCGLNAWAVGDVNDDGYGDMILDASHESLSPSLQAAGRAYVYSGATGEILHTLVSPNPEAYGYFGLSFAGIGDADGDGHDDFVVAARDEDGGAPDAGRVYVFSGATGDTLYTVQSPNPEEDGALGHWVSAAGDVNSNGYCDIIAATSRVAPWWAAQWGEGRAYVFDGQAGDLLHTLESPNEEPEGRFACLVSGLGDVDGDGYDDVAVGACREDVDRVDAGRAYVFSGAGGDLLYTLVSPNQETNGYFGWTVMSAGDVNNDGCPDVAVGAYGENGGATDAGRSYVFSGDDGALIYAFQSPNPEYEGWFGGAVGAGDVNQDGYADVMVSGFAEDPGASPTDAGRMYVFCGRTGTILRTLASPNETPAYGWGAYFGLSGAPLGDLNGDGYLDVVVGAGGEDPGGVVDAGRAYVISLDSTITSAPDVMVAAPSVVSLGGPYPNPTAGDEVHLRLQLLEGSSRPAKLSLYDGAGRCIATVLDGTVQGGEKLTLTWSPPEKLGPGVYYWRLKAGTESVQRPMIIAK